MGVPGSGLGKPVSKTTVASQNWVGQLHPNTARVSSLYRIGLACPLPTDIGRRPSHLLWSTWTIIGDLGGGRCRWVRDKLNQFYTRKRPVRCSDAADQPSSGRLLLSSRQVSPSPSRVLPRYASCAKNVRLLGRRWAL